MQLASSVVTYVCNVYIAMQYSVDVLVVVRARAGSSSGSSRWSGRGSYMLQQVSGVHAGRGPSAIHQLLVWE